MKGAFYLSAIAFLTAVPAQACPGPMLRTSIVLDAIRPTLPPGAVVLKVRLLGDARELHSKMQSQEPVFAHILGGGGLSGTIVRLLGRYTSCSGIGPVEGYVAGHIDRSRPDAIVVRFLQYRSYDQRWLPADSGTPRP